MRAGLLLWGCLCGARRHGEQSACLTLGSADFGHQCQLALAVKLALCSALPQRTVQRVCKRVGVCMPGCSCGVDARVCAGTWTPVTGHACGVHARVCAGPGRPLLRAVHGLRLSCRGHKRKLPEEDVGGVSSGASSGESSGADEEGSSSEADEMAAALEAELSDLM